MAKKKEKSSSSLSEEADLAGKIIIDSRGVEIGTCKSVVIGDDGQIGLTFETKINDKLVVPSQTIPYSAIGEITDVIELKVPIAIKIAQSMEEIKNNGVATDAKEIIESMERKQLESEVESEAVTQPKTPTKKETKPKEPTIISKEPPEEIEAEGQTLPSIEARPEATVSKVAEEADEEETVSLEKDPREQTPSLADTKTETKIQADPSQQLSKSLDDSTLAKESVIEEEKTGKKEESVVEELALGLEEALEKLERLFQLLSEEDEETKCAAIEALTKFSRVSPELGRSLIPKLMRLKDDSQHNVRMTIAQQFGKIGETNPELFRGYFLELLKTAYEEPIEEIREELIKALHDTAMRVPEIASEGMEDFLREVIIGKIAPEVPAKVLHETTLTVVSGNFLLTRIAIRSRLAFIATKGEPLGERCAEELKDFNATLIGLTIIELFTPAEAEKLLKTNNFKKIGAIFLDIITKMIEAYREGSFQLLEKVVDKKIEIPNSVIERFLEIKVTETLNGVKNVPLDFFTKDSIISEELAEKIIYEMIVQKKINASINIKDNRTFVTVLEPDSKIEKEEEAKKVKKPKTPPTAKKPRAKKTPTKPSPPKKSTKEKAEKEKPESASDMKSTTLEETSVPAPPASKNSTTKSSTATKKKPTKKPSTTKKKTKSSTATKKTTAKSRKTSTTQKASSETSRKKSSKSTTTKSSKKKPPSKKEESET